MCHLPRLGPTLPPFTLNHTHRRHRVNTYHSRPLSKPSSSRFTFHPHPSIHSSTHPQYQYPLLYTHLPTCYPRPSSLSTPVALYIARRLCHHVSQDWTSTIKAIPPVTPQHTGSPPGRLASAPCTTSAILPSQTHRDCATSPSPPSSLIPCAYATPPLRDQTHLIFDLVAPISSPSRAAIHSSI